MLRLLASLFFASAVLAAPPVAPGQRILFIGDSITYGAGYIAMVDTGLVLSDPDTKYDVISAGLSSETTSGLSEPGHAGGKFERPDVHERLDRVLSKTKPDLVLACYGMNDGIYMPLAEERFKAFRDGITKLHDKVTATGAKINHLTPPVFDPEAIPQRVDMSGEPGKMYAKYNEVLDRYSDWLIEQRKKGWDVIDLHGPMKSALAAGRTSNPKFLFSKDGVHPGDEGHALMAAAVLDAWGIAPKARDFRLHPQGTEVLKLIRQKTEVLRDAWLTETGHKRPGVKAGLPLAEANAKAIEADAAARGLAKGK